jgi:hypothetical protein
MPDPLNSKEIAKFAAEGVAIALAARDERFHGPIHIICGRPTELFRIEIKADQLGAVRPGQVQEHDLAG